MSDQSDLRQLSRLGTIRQLEIFVEVAEHRSIAKAAKALHLTQPTVSIQLKKLSTMIGLPLYEIVGRQLALTEAGRTVKKSADSIFSTLKTLRSDIGDLQGLKLGHLDLSVVNTAQYFMSYLIAPFCDLYPNIHVQLHAGNRLQIIERLKQNLDDLYILGDMPASDSILTDPFLPNPITVVCSKQHKLANRTSLSLADIENERFILREAGSGAMNKIQDHLKSNNIHLNNTMTIESNEAIKHAVMANMGISIMSAYVLSNAEMDGLCQLPVEGFPLSSQWEITRPKDAALSPAAQCFLSFVLERGRNLLPIRKIERNLSKALGMPLVI